MPNSNLSGNRTCTGTKAPWTIRPCCCCCCPWFSTAAQMHLYRLPRGRYSSSMTSVVSLSSGRKAGVFRRPDRRGLTIGGKSRSWTTCLAFRNVCSAHSQPPAETRRVSQGILKTYVCSGSLSSERCVGPCSPSQVDLGYKVVSGRPRLLHRRIQIEQRSQAVASSTENPSIAEFPIFEPLSEPSPCPFTNWRHWAEAAVVGWK